MRATVFTIGSLAARREGWLIEMPGIWLVTELPGLPEPSSASLCSTKLSPVSLKREGGGFTLPDF